MRAWVVMVVVGCAGAPRGPAAAPPPAPAPARDLAVAEPAPPHPRASASPRRGPIVLNAPLSQDEVIVFERRFARAEPLAEARSDFWDPCVRELVASRPRPERDALGDALALATTTCDRTGHRATFSPPARRAYVAGSYLGFAGEVTPRSVRLELVIVRRGGPPPDRITLLAGSTRWTSPRLDVEQDGDAFVARIPYTRSVARALHAALEATDPILRFESETGADDVPISDDIRSDLRVFEDLAD